MVSNDGEYHDAVSHAVAPSWTRRVVALAAVSAVFGSAAIYSSEQGMFTTAASSLASEEDGAPTTFGYHATPLVSNIDQGFVQVIGRFATTDEGIGG